MISVCMASFNGNKYIKKQLDSILSQLGIDDEVIIVDDASEDDTVSTIMNFDDPRIKLFENENNTGVIASFERSITLAKGEIIFLSDQDDIWLPNKIQKMMSLFQKNSEVTLCLSDALIIDDSGKVGEFTYFGLRGQFQHGLISNIIKNRFLGCSIAFKKSLIKKILPIPSKVPAHDMWIGLINEMYGSTAYIDEPLFQYRRHSGNVSSMTHAKVLRMVRWRIILIYHISLRVFRILFGLKN